MDFVSVNRRAVMMVVAVGVALVDMQEWRLGVEGE
jgi:hypothetical protein